MNNTIFANGNDIYKAGIAGAKRGYNRGADDYSKYEDLLSGCYNEMLQDIGDEAVMAHVFETTKGMWQNAKLPLCLAMLHRHKGGKECEVHARVYLYTNPTAVFDIPLLHWQRLCTKNDKSFKKAAA